MIPSHRDSDNVSLLLGDGLGWFTAASRATVPTRVTPLAVVALDLSGDRKPDLAVSSFDRSTVNILTSLSQ